MNTIYFLYFVFFQDEPCSSVQVPSSLDKKNSASFPVKSKQWLKHYIISEVTITCILKCNEILMLSC